MNLDEITELVQKRLEAAKPRALLIGDAPPWEGPYQWVEQAPYEVVVLGLLTPGQLLQMPTDPVCQALLTDQPVYLWPHQPYRQSKTARLLCRELAAAEQHLKQLGVQPLSERGRLITAQDARQLLREGSLLPPGSRLTPLAREILEGKV